ncbi:MAG: hypothetical protein HY290_28570 [Planctomycetia bacterium]|nr:hypothetical protein [Planctomycetia bacterium]
MTRLRFIVLTIGPPAILVAAYTLCFPAHDHEQATQVAQFVEAEATAALERAGRHDALAAACAVEARTVLPSLPKSSHLLIRPPFVIAGDLSEAELENLYEQAVLPVTSGLWRSYFDHKPDAPVTIVALRGDASFAAAAAELDGYESSSYAGYTQRGQRRIVVNLATGRGTLAHELSHLLALFDFPGMPEWFDEGLASLHEETVFSDDGLTLIGVENWRSRLLHDALHRKQLPALESVIRNPAFRGEGEGLNYAIVRGFCHYLQERGLLSHFYRKFRDGVQQDPTGSATLCELLGAADIGEVDRQFRSWLEARAGR